MGNTGHIDSSNDDGISGVDINKEMQEAYLQYSMSVIVGRALPDVRDGLKPVHRRILFAMHDLRNTHDKPYKKSARVVGDVIGKYHPHGDTAAYDTMVRMAQSFSLRYPLVDGQGNFGSIDGDSPAAARYTEVRMEELAEYLLEDIDKETVSFVPNYDDSLMVPQVLPAKFPNLLVNGSAGIAVGMATNIPPHNLTEVVDACVHLIKNPMCTVDDLIAIIPGPDFPTAGVIAGRAGILSAYKKGAGIITIKAVTEIEKIRERDQIIITEIPYQVNKAKLIENIADLVRDKKIEGISDIRDESSREGMRVVVLIKRNEDPNVILNKLFKYTQLQISFGIRLLALDVKNQPITFNLKSLLDAFIDHRREVVTKRCVYDLKKTEARIHILDGLKKAIDNIDRIIELVKSSKESQEARSRLIEDFSFTEIQAQAILDMRIHRLTGLEKQKIVTELESLLKQAAWLRDVLSDIAKIYEIIVEELQEIKKKFGDSRRTQITDDSKDFVDDDLIASGNFVVMMTDSGYVKRISLDEYRTQKRGGKGLKGSSGVEEDFVNRIFVADTKTNLLIFSTTGKVYWSKVHRIPMASRIGKGRAIANLVNLGPDERVRAILPIEDFTEDRYIVMVTNKGVIKKTALKAFSNPRQMGLIALSTDEGDFVKEVRLSDGRSEIFLATKFGQSIRFRESDVRAMGRSARGVKGITLADNDEVVGAEILSPNSESILLLVTEKGCGKRTSSLDYRIQSRGGVGIITQKTTTRTGNVISVQSVDENNEIIVTTDKGQTIRVGTNDVSLFGRNAQGVRLINLNPDERVTGVAVINDSGNNSGDEELENTEKN